MPTVQRLLHWRIVLIASCLFSVAVPASQAQTGSGTAGTVTIWQTSSTIASTGPSPWIDVTVPVPPNPIGSGPRLDSKLHDDWSQLHRQQHCH